MEINQIPCFYCGIFGHWVLLLLFILEQKQKMQTCIKNFVDLLSI